MSANILQIEVIPFGKSFIHSRNIRGPRTEPYRTPANMLFHEDVWSSKTTLCLL